jgi:hypothetical protein
MSEDDRRSADDSTSDALEDDVAWLVSAYAEQRVNALATRHRRALDGNQDGQALLRDAVERAVDLGLRAHLDTLGGPGHSGRGWDRDRLRAGWEQAREGALLLDRPPELSVGTCEEAEELTLDAAEQLGLAGGPRRGGGWRTAGREAAWAGAVLAEVLARGASRLPMPPDAAAEPPPSALEGELVAVATAANQAEAELIQGRLAQAGVMSTWRRTGGDLPALLAAGYREVLVPAGAESRARDLLAARPALSSDEPATRAVGLERRWLRLTGKLAALITAAGGLIALPLFLSGAARVVATVAEVFLLIGVLAWSELRRGRSAADRA